MQIKLNCRLPLAAALCLHLLEPAPQRGLLLGARRQHIWGVRRAVAAVKVLVVRSVLNRNRNLSNRAPPPPPPPHTCATSLAGQQTRTGRTCQQMVCNDWTCTSERERSVWITVNDIIIAQFPIANHSQQGQFAEFPQKTIGKVQNLVDYDAIRSSNVRGLSPYDGWV